MEPIFESVAIVGPGLVGASLGMAIRRHGLAGRVIGIGRRESSLQEALDVGAVDEVTLDLAGGVGKGELVVLATPIGVIPTLLPQIAAAIRRSALLTDVASTKQAVIGQVTAALKARADVVYVPTHPMAGSERKGAANATADLFEGRACIFTPLPGGAGGELKRLRALWERVGASVHLMDPASHDGLVARISHLPHLAAAALLECVTAEQGSFAAGGLFDTTRVASGEPALWRDICATNAHEISAAMAECEKVLGRMRALLDAGRLDELEQTLRRAKRKRDDLLARQHVPRTPT